MNPLFSLSQINLVYRKILVSERINLDICTVNYTKETEGIQLEKAALNPLVSRWSVSFKFSFCGGKTNLHTPLQQTNEQTHTTSK